MAANPKKEIDLPRFKGKVQNIGQSLYISETYPEKKDKPVIQMSIRQHDGRGGRYPSDINAVEMLPDDPIK